MAEEFQPYFYLSHKDIKTPQPGKIIGFLLLFVFLILLFCKLVFRWPLSWQGLLLILGFAVISIFLGKVIHKGKKAEPDDDDQKEPPREPRDPPQIVEEGHSL